MFEFIMEVVFPTMLFICLLIATIYTVVYIPVLIHTESKCLAKGYPEARVDWKLNTYCMNLDGTITVKVEEID